MKASGDRMVSVVMSAYNHAPYVGSAIESVLSQTHGDIEFLITDDGSSDGTVEEIAKYRDPRIVFVPSSVNRGACVATNELIYKARGRYVCVMNSDDVWCFQGKLEEQLTVLENRHEIGATFGRARYIDEQGGVLDKSLLPDGGIFDQENRSRHAWLEKFFMEGNCLCHPTVMIRRECYDRLGVYRNTLRQLPDFDMWVRLAKHYEIDVSGAELVSFRVLPGQNASGSHGRNAFRLINEYYLLRRSFFEGMSDTDFRTAFGRYFVKKEANDGISLEIEKALLYFSDSSHSLFIHRIIGLERIHSLLERPDSRRVLADSYGINDRWFHERTGKVRTLYDAIVPPKPSLSIHEKLIRRVKARLGSLFHSM
jgi:glycosyltransferase involved in cell wall biosynthesis